jgi:hypothetical protein
MPPGWGGDEEVEIVKATLTGLLFRSAELGQVVAPGLGRIRRGRRGIGHLRVAGAAHGG